MINNSRIVPIEKCDYLSMIGTVMKLAGTSFSVVNVGLDGLATVSGSGAAGNKLFNAPVKNINFGSGVTSGTAYFVADYDFDAIKVNGSAATIADASPVDLDEVKCDGITLYTAALSSGEVTITEISPEQP